MSEWCLHYKQVEMLLKYPPSSGQSSTSQSYEYLGKVCHAINEEFEVTSWS